MSVPSARIAANCAARELRAREKAAAALAAALADAAGPAAREAAAVARAENRQAQAVQTDWEPIAMPLPAPPKPAGRAP